MIRDASPELAPVRKGTEQTQRGLEWTNILFLTISPVIGIFGTGIYVYFNGVHPLEIILFAVLYVATGISITAGYHRLFAHRSYDCHPLLRLFYLVFGACAFQNSVQRWASDHRAHHKYVDTDLDPYNIKRGGWYAHIGWIFFKRDQDSNLININDLRSDPLVAWQQKYYVPIAIIAGLLIPCLIGLAISRPLGGLLWGGFLRIVFVHHMTFFINSLAHMVGKQTYSNEDSSKDSWWLAFLTYGEGYHNFHHKFQADYRNGVRWYHWDPSKWVIGLGSLFGLTSRLKRTPNRMILQAKLAMDLYHVRTGMRWLPQDIWNGIQKRLEVRRADLETAHAKLVQARAAYQEIKASKMIQSQKVLLKWKRRKKVYERKFDRAKVEWQEVLQSASVQARKFQTVS